MTKTPRRRALGRDVGRDARRAHEGYGAPRSAELPSLDVLASSARETADWYVDYADALAPEEVDEAVAFFFANG